MSYRNPYHASRRVRNYPHTTVVYTLRGLMQLELLDTPSLGFTYEGLRGYVQDAHTTGEQLLSVPGLAETKWRYLRTTHEWIPCFESVDVSTLIACLDLEPLRDKYFPESDGKFWWATPKGFPRKQN